MFDHHSNYPERDQLVSFLGEDGANLHELSTTDHMYQQCSQNQTLESIYEDTITQSFCLENDFFTKDPVQSSDESHQSPLTFQKKQNIEIINPEVPSSYSQTNTDLSHTLLDLEQSPLNQTQESENEEISKIEDFNHQHQNIQKLANEKQCGKNITHKKRVNKDSAWKLLLRKFRKDIRKVYNSQEGANAYLLSEEKLQLKVIRFFMEFLRSKPTFTSELDIHDKKSRFSQTDLRKVKFILLIAPTMRKREFTLIQNYKEIVRYLQPCYIDIFKNNNDTLMRKFLQDPLLKLLFQDFLATNSRLIEGFEEGEKILLQKDFEEYKLDWPLQ